MNYLVIEDDELFHLLEDTVVCYQRMISASTDTLIPANLLLKEATKSSSMDICGVLHEISYLGGVLNGDHIHPFLSDLQRRVISAHLAAAALALILLPGLSQET